MKLDRNLNADGRGKYGLILNRRLMDGKKKWSPGFARQVANAIEVLESAGIIDWGATPDTEFFVMRLRDRFASNALISYSQGAMGYDPEYAIEVGKLAHRSGYYHPNAKTPD